MRRVIALMALCLCLQQSLFGLLTYNTNDGHTVRLKRLQEKGFSPRVIYDIGAHEGLWTLSISQVFKHSQFFLFEANESKSPFLRKLPYKHFICLLGDCEKDVTFYTNNTTGDSLYKEQTHFYEEGKYIPKIMHMVPLKSIVQEQQLPWPDLIKMDVQGAEKLILQGSPEIIQHAEVVLLETQNLEYNKDAPLTLEIMNYMDELGFQFIDVAALLYLPSGELFQLDLLFAKKDSKLIKRGNLVP